MILVEENPLANLKILYGTRAVYLNKANEVARVGGVRYTIKDGIVYDAPQLLADVKQMVDEGRSGNQGVGAALAGEFRELGRQLYFTGPLIGNLPRVRFQRSH